MNILVTGGTGYIGSHTVVELLNEGHEVTILDNIANSKITVLDKIEKITSIRPEFHQIDLLDYTTLEKVFRETHYDLVLHFAGLKAVAESVEQPLKYYENNLVGTLNLLKAMKKSGTNKIIFSSSATVYGEQQTPAYTEEMQTGLNIASPYGRTKYMIEEILKDYCVAHPDFSAVILRYFNPIGAHPSGLLGENPTGHPNNLMPIIMKVARGELESLQVYGNDYPTRDGTCVRDYLHVVDLAKGHLAAMPALNTPGVHIYNLGTGRGTTVLEMIKCFNSASHQELPYHIAPRRPGDLPEFYANPEKAQKELGWSAHLTIDDAMRDTLNYLSKI
ncbi:UDP-glucose 4-epimerase GalE [Candidatus Saccharibacteria bacterium]|nr:UDP-glucose 4-epimerase GalE [Candidatus Saccharibacteria bacterium]